jgi:hypothetical protein
MTFGDVMFGRYRRPRYPGDLNFEVMREMRRTRRVGILVLAAVAGLGLLLMATRSAVGIGIGLWLILAGAVTADAAAITFLGRRRVKPAAEVLNWWAEMTLQDWRAIDGGVPPKTPAEAVGRLEGAEGDLATATRLSYWLSPLEDSRPADLQAQIERWRPPDPGLLARRARYLARLAFEAGTDDLTEARRVADAIEGPEQRARQQVLTDIGEARRRAIKGQPAVAVLVAARAKLGAVETPLLRQMARPSARRRLIRYVALAMIGIVYGLLVCGTLAIVLGLLIQ